MTFAQEYTEVHFISDTCVRTFWLSIYIFQITISFVRVGAKRRDTLVRIFVGR